MEPRIHAEVGHVAARSGITRKDASRIVAALLDLYEKEIKNAPMGKSFRECYDIQTVKIDPAGNAVWDRIYGGLVNFSDIPYDVTTDRFGGAYVVGEVWSTGPIREYFTIKYDPTGTLEWAQRYGGAVNNPSYGLAVAVSPDLLVAVTGYSGAFGPFGDSDIATVGYKQPLPTGVPTVAQGPPVTLRVAPNPVQLGATFSFDSGAGARMLDILDVRGRRVASLDAAGRGGARWEPGPSAPSGVYFARLRAAGRAPAGR